MKVDMSYQGALAARYRKEAPNWREHAETLSGREIEVSHNGETVKLTFSGELVEFKGVVEDLYASSLNKQNFDPADIFSFKPKDQWLVFSQYLADNHYFDGMSDDETNRVETLLKRITDGLDGLSLTEPGINIYSGVEEQLNSYEAQVEFASSSAALALFSKSYLSGELQAGFDQLIGQYVDHNAKTALTHQSLEEIFYTARAKLSSASPFIGNGGSSSELGITNKLGGLQHSAQDVDGLIADYTGIFANISGADDISLALESARNRMIQFMTRTFPQGTPSERAADFVNRKAEDTFRRMAEYWGQLFV
ncbi:hypothetical protein V3851_10875 [Paenibacillus sp. M1]|uniref:Uncharacterized protein n=1 Tax=Paenibacillus haidiansis TaxID=1574488 RepID=A0ABU7VRD2_9BACL